MSYKLSTPVGGGEFASTMRQNVFKVLILIFALIYIGRLAQMQIIKGSEYRSESEAQAIKEEIVEPFRGNIYDRNGQLMVHNEPSFTVAITTGEFLRDSSSIILLSKFLEMDVSEMRAVLDNYAKESRVKPIKIFKDIDLKKVALIEENYENLKGVDIVIESKRLYNFDFNMAHLLGYVREITKPEMEKKKTDEYRQGDIVGKTGLEKYYETQLRGSKGIKYIGVNRSGRKVASFNNEKNDKLVSNGYDLYLSIDKRLQETAEKLMLNLRGAAVAIDPNNGEILALCSKPDYDPRKFTGKISGSVYNELYNDPLKPLFNRATMAAYPCGSTWKPMLALAGLQEGVITASTVLSCPGSFQFGNRSYGCHAAHGAMTVERAIQASCNVFFYKLALNLGLDKLSYYAKMFGLGSLTKIDIAEEKAGFIPTVEWVTRKFGAGAVRGRTVNYGIGQGEISVTPLQLAVYASIVANKGTWYQPHAVKSWFNNVTNKMEYVNYNKRELPISKSNFDIVQKGMFDVVNVPGGTAGIAKIPGISVCGKTGTAQNPHGKDHSLFICFAPMENPKIAIAVLAENAGFGAATAAPIAREMLRAFFFPDSAKTINAIPPSTQGDEIPD